AVVVRSSAAHGLIKAIDTTAAGKMSGVHAVYTGRDVARENHGKSPTIPLRLAPLTQLTPFEQDVIAVDRVRYVGECLAIVVAETQAQAEDAASRIDLTIEDLPAVPHCRAAARGETLLFPAHGTNAAITYVAEKGNARNAVGPYVRR